MDSQAHEALVTLSQMQFFSLEDLQEPQIADGAPLLDGEEWIMQRRLAPHKAVLIAKRIARQTITLASMIGKIFVPSFLISGGQANASNHTDTAYLNGLRGLAAFAVYNGHLISPLHPTLLYGYGQKDHSAILQLPILRLIYSGSALVALFFVLSGLVLSKRPIDLMKMDDPDHASAALAASIFKRGFRIYIPPLISTFIVMLLSRQHLFEDPLLSRLNTRHPIRFETFHEQILDWANFVVSFLFSPSHWFPGELESHYGAHLWTIPITMSCSMLLYVTLLGLGKLSKVPFLVFTSGLVSYNMLVKREPLGLYYFGMIIAYISPWPPEKTELNISQRKTSFLSQTTGTLSIIVGLYLSSYPPNDDGTTPGYLNSVKKLSPLTYWAFGAMAIVGGLPYQPHIQRFLGWTTLQYFGKISFSLYIVHEPLLQMFGWRYFLAVEKAPALQKQPPIVFYLAQLVAWVLITIFTTLIADLFWRHVESPSVQFTDWIKRKLFRH